MEYLVVYLRTRKFQVVYTSVDGGESRVSAPATFLPYLLVYTL